LNQKLDITERNNESQANYREADFDIEKADDGKRSPFCLSFYID